MQEWIHPKLPQPLYNSNRLDPYQPPFQIFYSSAQNELRPPVVVYQSYVYARASTSRTSRYVTWRGHVIAAPRKEVPSLIPASNSRPADIFLPNWSRGRPDFLGNFDAATKFPSVQISCDTCRIIRPHK